MVFRGVCRQAVGTGRGVLESCLLGSCCQQPGSQAEQACLHSVGPGSGQGHEQDRLWAVGERTSVLLV